jgi:hypothetical protein
MVERVAEIYATEATLCNTAFYKAFTVKVLQLFSV